MTRYKGSIKESAKAVKEIFARLILIEGIIGGGDSYDDKVDRLDVVIAAVIRGMAIPDPETRTPGPIMRLKCISCGYSIRTFTPPDAFACPACGAQLVAVKTRGPKVPKAFSVKKTENASGGHVPDCYDVFINGTEKGIVWKEDFYWQHNCTRDDDGSAPFKTKKDAIADVQVTWADEIAGETGAGLEPEQDDTAETDTGTTGADTLADAPDTETAADMGLEVEQINPK